MSRLNRILLAAACLLVPTQTPAQEDAHTVTNATVLIFSHICFSFRLESYGTVVGIRRALPGGMVMGLGGTAPPGYYPNSDVHLQTGTLSLK